MLAAEGLALAGLAIVLAWPLPAALARARWPGRSPRAALVLWQAIGLGGGLAILGAGVTLAVSGLHRSWLGGVTALPHAVLSGGVLPGGVLAGSGPRLGLPGWAGVALTVVAGAWLGYVLVTSTARLLLARREHRLRLDLLTDELALADLRTAEPGGRPDGGANSGVESGAHSGAAGGLDSGVRVRLLDHPAAAAYCLPGVRPRIVVSRGVLDVLSRDELEAVVTHERAHARTHHDLVIQPFRAWRATFPFLAAARAALLAVDLLVEMLADDVARRRCGPAPLHAALRRLADDAPRDPAGDGQLAARAARLAIPPAPLRPVVVAGVYTLAVLIVVLPPVVLLAS